MKIANAIFLLASLSVSGAAAYETPYLRASVLNGASDDSSSSSSSDDSSEDKENSTNSKSDDIDYSQPKIRVNYSYYCQAKRRANCEGDDKCVWDNHMCMAKKKFFYEHPRKPKIHHSLFEPPKSEPSRSRSSSDDTPSCYDKSKADCFPATNGMCAWVDGKCMWNFNPPSLSKTFKSNFDFEFEEDNSDSHDSKSSSSTSSNDGPITIGKHRVSYCADNKKEADCIGRCHWVGNECQVKFDHPLFKTSKSKSSSSDEEVVTELA